MPPLSAALLPSYILISCPSFPFSSLCVWFSLWPSSSFISLSPFPLWCLPEKHCFYPNIAHFMTTGHLSLQGSFSFPSSFALICLSLDFILPLHLPWAKGGRNICQCISSEALSLSPRSSSSSPVPVLGIEVWEPCHLGGGAAPSRVPWKRSVGCVPDTGRLSMHWMRSQTRWSVMGVCES